MGLGYMQEGDRIEMASAAQAASEIPEKSLFRIGEVSRLTATKAFVLRYWESEFPTLQPVKSPSGHRLYRREDIETVFEIKRLLYEEGFTIAGARKHLAEQGSGATNGSGPGAHAAHGQHAEDAALVAPPVHVPIHSGHVSAAKSEAAARAYQKFLLDLHEELLAVLTLLEGE
jgi:DNA-binding transcriptional MerR regulator